MVNITAASTVTCDPALGILTSCSIAERLLDIEYLKKEMLQWEFLVFLAFIFLFVWAARWTYQIKLWLMVRKTHNYSFAHGFKHALTEEDNKALSLSFAGYMIAVGLILWSSLTGLTTSPGANIGYAVEWQALGVLFLEMARLLNDKVVLSARTGTAYLNNNEELMRKNVAVGAAEAGSYIATGLIIMAANSGVPSAGEFWWRDILTSLIWFGFGQIGFFLFNLVMNWKVLLGFDVYDQIRQGNVAAGTLFALQLISIANVLSNSILKSASLVTFAIWFLLGGGVLVLARLLVDYAIIPTQALKHEIAVDRNVGAAFLVGGVSVGLTLVINTFLPDTCST